MKISFDEQIKQIFKKNRKNKLPKETELIINNTLESLRKDKFVNRKQIMYKIAACFMVCLIGCGIVYAKEIKNLAQNIFKYDVKGTQGVQVATDKGYVQNVDMEYIESNNVKFKIDYVTMDDTNLALNFNFMLDVNAEGFNGISIYDMKIYDDNNNMIYTDEEKFPNESIALGGGIHKTVFISGNNVVQSFLIESDRFPKTKTLRITFDKITLYNENKGNPITKELNGKFDITVNLDEKFYNRKTIEYDIEDKENEDYFGLKRAFLTDTSFNIIINHPKSNRVSIEIKDTDGKILYSEKNRYLMKTNDNTDNKILKIDITKYDKLSDIMELTIIENSSNEESENIYLYNQENQNGVYDVSKYQGGNKIIKNNEIEKYILKKID